MWVGGQEAPPTRLLRCARNDEWGRGSTGTQTGKRARPTAPPDCYAALAMTGGSWFYMRTDEQVGKAYRPTRLLRCARNDGGVVVLHADRRASGQMGMAGKWAGGRGVRVTVGPLIPFDKLSNCLDCQAEIGFQRTRCFTMALRMVSSLRMQAIMATFLGLPTSTRRE